MKTAEEWAKDLDTIQECQGVQQQHELAAIIANIQLDAYKAGMTEAASIPESWIHTNCKRVSCDKCESNKFVYLAILSARDRKTSL